MADERAELIDWLRSSGIPEERIDDAQERGLLPFLPAAITVSGAERLTADQVAERSGLDIGLFERLRRANALPVAPRDTAEYGQPEVEIARLMAEFLEMGLQPEQLEAVARVLGRGLSQAGEVMRAVVLEAVLSPGLTEKELAQRYGAVVELVMPRLGPLLDGLVRSHLVQMVEAEGVDATERIAGRLPGARDATVCFADLVGFTKMGEQVEPDRLGAVADRLAVLAADVVAPPVRIVKTIGDAVMLVAPEPAALLRTAFAILDAVEAEGEDFPQVHIGLASGPVVNRGGDWFGSPVNVASRVSAAARAGSILVTQEVHDATRDGADWSFAGERRMKGLRSTVKLYRARPLPA